MAFNGVDTPDFLYHNNGNSNHWITIKLVGTWTNKSAIGTKIRVKATINGFSVWQMREVSAQTSYNGQNDLRVHFGLGDATIIEEIKVEWLSDVDETYLNIPTNQFISIVEGNGILGLNTVDRSNDITIYPNPVASVLNIDFKVTEVTDIRIYNMLGQMVLEIPNTQQTKSIDVSSLKTGNYFMKINSDKGNSSLKFMKL